MTLEKVERECPYCNEIQYVNIKVFANHVKWCKANPSYEEDKKELIRKIHDSNKNSKFRKRTYNLKCEICDDPYTIQETEHNFLKGKYRRTCSDTCARKLTNLHTKKDERNKKISESLKTYAYYKHKEEGIDYVIECGKYEKTCPCCKKKFITKKKYSKFCSKTCADKNRKNEYNKNKNIKQIYKKECKFLFSLNSYPDEFDFILIEENGWYNAKNHGENPNGVSRDHMFSITEGYNQKVDPYLISHPANCQLIFQRNNASKGTKCTITLYELKERIRIWEEKYGVYENHINYDGLNDFLGK